MHSRPAAAETQPLLREKMASSREFYTPTPGGSRDDEEFGTSVGDDSFFTPLPWWKKYKRALIIGVSVLGVVLVGLIITAAVVSSRHDSSKHTTTGPKNVIVMITDGFGPASVTLARTLNGAPLQLDRMIRGTIRTKSADSLVTDSAAGATSYSCGLKTNNTFVAVDPRGRACGTILEAAQKKGMRTGLVVTSRITDATPASFSSHSVTRYAQEFIASQQVTKGIDIMFGGGRDYYLPKSEGGLREDGKNLLDEAAKAGVSVATTLNQFNAISKMPTLGLFGMSHLDYTIDRNLEQPTLAQMVAKALSLLEKDSPKGFFLMVEGSRIDHAGHDNDAATHYREVLAYDDALKEIITFAEKDGDTLVVSVSDHETGGLTLGVTPRDGSYPVYDWYPDVLRPVQASAYKMAAAIRAAAPNGSEEQLLEAAKTVLREKAGLELSQEDLILLAPALSPNPTGIPLLNVIGNIIAYRAGIAWTTLGHTGVDINLYSYTKAPNVDLPGVKITEKFGNGGNLENFDVGQYLIDVGHFDVEAITRALQSFNPSPPAQEKTKRQTQKANVDVVVDVYHPEL
jgi:alkaline phosphatase